MDKRKDNIYIYIWEDLNTIYIGRTIDPKRRHRQHKNRERERTYQFSSKYHVEHPAMVILEENLSILDGVEREKYWINYYRENSKYAVLNKSYGGELGSLGESNEEKRKEYLKKYLKEYYQKNKEKYREREKKYRQEHLEEVREKDRIRYHKNKFQHKPLSEREKNTKKEYYQKNKENILTKNKEYKKNNREKILEYKRKYRETHKEQIKKYNKKYRENHK